ncbi:hypothetical protein [Listeria seeligeri]|uniref:hypothetical protein n=1 Tax=Listeria seeligeri TaxID=1640 RepID=UPI0022EB286D|nr:hypothetical protein [Listeria seeligeri]
MESVEKQAYEAGVTYRKKQLVSEGNYQTLVYKLTSIIKKGSKEAFVETLLDYSKVKRKQIPSVFQEDVMNEEKTFKSSAYAFVIGLTQ